MIRHFVQEDAGPQLDALINDFVAGRTVSGFSIEQDGEHRKRRIWMSDQDPVEFVSNDGVATITLNRPETLNAMNNDLMRGLRDSIGRVVADGELDDEVARVAAILKRSSPSAATRIRATIDAAARNTFREQLDLEMEHQAVLIPRNMQNGAQAFMAKRVPEFGAERD
ncbi:MAG: hypothetical protein OES38_11990 [Gammaproteobacteria bacterium]|nr:hypothetical protein [Gammaproteobacteria bacterium]